MKTESNTNQTSYHTIKRAIKSREWEPGGNRLIPEYKISKNLRLGLRKMKNLLTEVKEREKETFESNAATAVLHPRLFTMVRGPQEDISKIKPPAN